MIKKYRIVIYAMLAYILPVLAFGNFEILDGPLGKFRYNYITIGVSIPILIFLLIKKSRRKKLEYYLTCILLGITMTLFRMSPFTIYSNETIMNISFIGSNIVAYWICFLAFISFYISYKTHCEILYKSQFLNDPILIKRDEKIDKILHRY